ncbi:MAG: hypothetical protein ACI9XO_001422, partial [Paraglaciecola sp.]
MQQFFNFTSDRQPSAVDHQPSKTIAPTTAHSIATTPFQSPLPQ